jgi:hypothetical protein
MQQAVLAFSALLYVRLMKPEQYRPEKNPEQEVLRCSSVEVQNMTVKTTKGNKNISNKLKTETHQREFWAT